MKKVSIAIPFFNAEKYILDAIRSVYAQTHKEWELILIDDGSTDASFDIVKSVKDNRVRIIRDGKRKNLATRLNEVTEIAQYDYIARMDADDLMSPDRIEIQMALFSKNKNLDLVSTGVYSVLNNLELKGIRGQNNESISFEDLINKKASIVHAAVIAKKEWYQRNHYDESLTIAQDLDLWFRTSKANDLNVKTISNPLYIYREEDNINVNKLKRAYKNELYYLKKYTKRSLIKKIKIHIKLLIVIILSRLGLLHLLLDRRNVKMSDSDKENYQKEMNTIMNTKIPGIDF